jgi:hypothetical protein
MDYILHKFGVSLTARMNLYKNLGIIKYIDSIMPR